MPLYALGFMGMPRRLVHYDNPIWQPYLLVALAGTFLIAYGIFCQGAQLVVSIRNRAALRDATGDIWGSHSLEWSVTSPPPFYNFAKLPEVESLDAFSHMKEHSIPYRAQAPFSPIHMPRNSRVGVAMGALTFAFGFAMVWHIWWMAAASTLAILALIVMRASDENLDYMVSAEEVARVENNIVYAAPPASAGLAPV